MDWQEGFLQWIQENIKLGDAAKWTKEAILIFILPRIFFRKFFARPISQQYIQTIYYLLILGIVAWILAENEDLKGVVHLSFSILVIAIIFSGLNALSLWIISKSHFKFRKVALVMVVTWTLFFIPSIFFLHLFVTSENYAFYFFSNLFSAWAFTYCLVLIWYIFFKEAKKRFLGILLNTLGINIAVFLLSLLFLLFFDKHSQTIFFDPILNELNHSLEQANVNSMVVPPYSFITADSKDSSQNYILSFCIHDDSVLYMYKPEAEYFIRQSGEYSKRLDSISSKLNCKRNKEILSEGSRYFKVVSLLLTIQPQNTWLLIDSIYHSAVYAGDTVRAREYVFPQYYFEAHKNFSDGIRHLILLSGYSSIPGVVPNLFLIPTKLIYYWLGWNKSVWIIFQI